MLQVVTRRVGEVVCAEGLRSLTTGFPFGKKA
jgi:hypothetical protein